MILHRKDRQLAMRQAFDRVVVQIQMRDFGRAFERIGVDCEAVVLRRDFHLARGEIHHRLIAAVVAELELVSFAAEREAHDLMAETDAEDRFFADQFLYIFFGVGHGVGIAGPVGEKNSVRIECQNIFRRRRCWNDFDSTAGLGEIAQNVVFDAVVVGDDKKCRRAKGSLAFCGLDMVFEPSRSL